MTEVDEQAWLAQRCGYLTASVAFNVLDKKKDGTPKAGYEQLKWAILAERMTGQHADHFINRSMQWGIENEDLAAQAYEVETGNVVTGTGKDFIPHEKIKWLGASPDRFVGKDGLVEIKCPETATHLYRLKTHEIPLQYQIQMQVQLACTGRKWVDFVDFDPRIDERRFGAARLWIQRYEPTHEEIEKTVQACVEFLEMIDKEIKELGRLNNDGL